MPEKKTVLIAEDAPVNRRVLVKLLAEDYDLIETENGQEALDVLTKRGESIAAVILDLVMPVLDGFGFLRAIQGRPEYGNIPVIVATGSTEDRTEVDALRLGAWDFITKPYNGEIIKFRLRGAIDRSQLTAFEQLRYLAEYDTLTGIYNKAKFLKTTRSMLDAHPEKAYVFIRADIDRFQLINSFYGTEEGDRLLRYLAEGLKRFDPGEFYSYGRIEADVFAVCCLYTSKEAVLAVLETAKEYVRAYNPSFDIVPMFGVYFLDDLTLPVSEMLDRAALAAKRCKDGYVNTVSVYQPQMSKKLELEQEVINEMVTALEKKQFVVYIQPKYSLETNSPAGAEALVRWLHPTKGLVPPSEFIPIFEKNGFITRLDNYMWEAVCGLLRDWIEQGLNPAPISVNVSRANLYNPNTAQIICDLAFKYAVPPSLLQLELTESAYMDNPQMMEQFTEEMHRRGFTILMDDFGSGYSSLSVLKNIRVDVLKIDMRFFEDGRIHGRGENIIASVIRMAKWLNIPTLAEGVEKAEQVDFLRSVGCDYVQGFYFARPMPVESYQRLITENASVSSVRVLAAGAVDVDKLWSTDPEMEMLFSNATQANCIYEFDGLELEALRVNKAFTDLFGYSRGVKITAPVDGIIASDRKRIYETFRKCADERENEECVYRRKNAEGHIIWVQLKLQYICRVGAKQIFLGHLTDITEQKILEFELSRFRMVSEGQEHRTKLLIVKDSQGGAEDLEHIFGKEYRVLLATDGKRGLELLQQNRDELALVLLDMIMPDKSGMEFLVQKNERPETARIPVVVVSPDSDFGRQAGMLRLGVCDYITKPFVPEVLERRVKNVLEYNGRIDAAVREQRKAASLMADERLFEINQVYAYAEMRMLLLFLSPVFDIIRLVDPVQTAIIALSEDGRVIREPYSCFHTWKKEMRCENCTGMCGLNGGCRMTKYEFIQNNVFYVVSNPVVVEDGGGQRHRFVLEIISRVSDHLMLQKFGGKTVGQLIEETQKKIYTDELTGVYNRRYLHEMLFAHHGQTDVAHSVALVMLDLSDFKSINDQYGHAIGDDVLVRTGKALAAVVRQKDSVIRYGGDEFIVTLTNCSEEQARSTIARMRDAVSTVKYGENSSMTASADFGYAYSKKFNLQREALDELMQTADKNMYIDKNSKKGED